jgi:hypothetical protein
MMPVTAIISAAEPVRKTSSASMSSIGADHALLDGVAARGATVSMTNSAGDALEDAGVARGREDRRRP